MKNLKEVCVANNASRECAAAWDKVKELSTQIAHNRVKKNGIKDPLKGNLQACARCKRVQGLQRYHQLQEIKFLRIFTPFNGTY